jgi:hypothetical protein
MSDVAPVFGHSIAVFAFRTLVYGYAMAKILPPRFQSRLFRSHGDEVPAGDPTNGFELNPGRLLPWVEALPTCGNRRLSWVEALPSRVEELRPQFWFIEPAVPHR